MSEMLAESQVDGICGLVAGQAVWIKATYLGEGQGYTAILYGNQCIYAHPKHVGVELVDGTLKMLEDES